MVQMQMPIHLDPDILVDQKEKIEHHCFWCRMEWDTVIRKNMVSREQHDKGDREILTLY